MDIMLLIEEYLKQHEADRHEDDSLNVCDGSIVRWDFKNILQPSMEELEALQESVQTKMDQEAINKEALEFLAASDFKVLRHIRQKALEQELSLSEEDYLALEQQRADAAARIVK
jgi:ethanolamine utilization cobalamin adenosyltransferase